jgi:ribosomal protein L16 Arg81 hydroxylase
MHPDSITNKITVDYDSVNTYLKNSICDNLSSNNLITEQKSKPVNGLHVAKNGIDDKLPENCFIEADLFKNLSWIDFIEDYWDKTPLLVVNSHIKELPLNSLFIYQAFLKMATIRNNFTSYNETNVHPDLNRECLISLWKNRLPELSDIESFNKKNTLLINGAQRHFKAISLLLNELNKIFNCHLNANIYTTRTNSSVFATHYDTHHVLAVQMEGEKDWYIWRPIVDAPHPKYEFGEVVSEGDPIVYRTTPGDLLYIPLGWLHHAKTINDPSIHMTIGITPPRWIDLIERIFRDACKEHSLFRRSLPFEFSEEDGFKYIADQSDHIEPVMDFMKEIVKARIHNYIDKHATYPDFD